MKDVILRLIQFNFDLILSLSHTIDEGERRELKRKLVELEKDILHMKEDENRESPAII